MEKSIIRPTPLFLYRVFNRGCWACGGRAYAWWQQLPKCFRAQLLINDEPVAEPDYSALHAALIYAERGVPIQQGTLTISKGSSGADANWRS